MTTQKRGETGGKRLTSPTFHPAEQLLIRQAAKQENRSVAGLIAHASITYATKVLAPKTD